MVDGDSESTGDEVVLGEKYQNYCIELIQAHAVATDATTASAAIELSISELAGSGLCKTFDAMPL